MVENGQKVDKFESIYISVVTDIDGKWFVVFEHISTTFLLVMFGYLNLDTIFLVLLLFSYFFFFSFSSAAIYF